MRGKNNKRIKEVRRPDGLRVFLNEDDPPWLNDLRSNMASEPLQVIEQVGELRKRQIMLNYAKKHKDENMEKFYQDHLDDFVNVFNEEAV